jgi:UDP-glucose 4-epimerase
VIILFGGSGFIGRHIAAAAEGNAQVTIVSRHADEEFLSSTAPSANFISAEEFSSERGADAIRSASALVYLANTSIPASNMSAPWQEISQNVDPALQLFTRVAQLNPTIRIIFPSSGGTVYGEGHHAPIPEAAPLAPISAYGLAKVMTEDALRYVSRQTNIDIAVLRISNPVGRWHKSMQQGLVEMALRKVARGEPLTVFGDGSHVRDYLDADDLARLILTMAGTEKRLAGVWNIGSGNGTSILEVLNVVSRLVGRQLKLTFAPARPWDVSYSVLNVERVRGDFGWSSPHPLSALVEKVAAHLL